MPFSDLTADFSWDGERTFLRGVRIRNQTGQLVAELFDAPGDFRLNVESTIVPSAARALASRDLAEFLSQWEWQRSPTIHLAIRGPDHHPENWRGEGTVAMNRTRFRGVWMNSATSKFHLADGALTFEDFRVARDEGVGTGGLRGLGVVAVVVVSPVGSVTTKSMSEYVWSEDPSWDGAQSAVSV